MTQNQPEPPRRLAARMGAAALLATMALAMPIGAGRLLAQDAAPAAARGYSIPAQPLSAALLSFGQASGLQIFVDDRITAGLRSTAITGPLSDEAALAGLLSGTGLHYRFTNPGTVSIVAPEQQAGAPGAEGTVLLGTIVIGGGRYRHQGATYDAPASISYYSQEEIQTFRGTSTGDFLKGEPGVLTGDNRNSGAIDLNIRGMQGEGRVATVIDGAVQQSTVYRGYSGVASRVYLDPDLISDVVIEKGPSSAPDAAGATGGVARISTLQTGDVLLPGRDRGFRLRLSTVGNTTSPPATWTLGTGNGPAESFARPGLLDAGSGSGSLAYAQVFGNFELVAAVTRRRIGNYFAGESGEGPESTGLNRFQLGEEVLNSSQDNSSGMLRGVYRWGDGHKVDAAFMRHESDFGELMPSQIIRFGGAWQAPLSRVEVDTASLRYTWKPEGSQLIDLDATLWRTENFTNIITPYLFSFGPISLDATQPFMSQSDRWGVNLSNTSRFTPGGGELALTYGLSYSHERLYAPDEWEAFKASSSYTTFLEPRNGEKDEYSAFVAAEYKPNGWLTLNGALRYITAQSHDYNAISYYDSGTRTTVTGYNSEDTSGWTPILSAMVEPIEGLQFYARYAEAIRTPSTFESTTGWSQSPSLVASLRPEHSHSSEIGVNFRADGFAAAGDQLQAKLSLFDNRVEDYITRSSYMTNIPKAEFRGVELSARYDHGRFYGEVSATKYTHTLFCDTDNTCRPGGTTGGYGQMHLPPDVTATLTLGGRFLEDRLDLGLRFTHVGDRASTVSNDASGGGTTVIDWQPYNLVDLFAAYDLNERTTFDIAIDNVTDEYYMDALSLGLMPSPGRTLRLGVTAKF